jgi:hypothetical protein
LRIDRIRREIINLDTPFEFGMARFLDGLATLVRRR